MASNFNLVAKYVLKSKKEFLLALLFTIISSAFTLSIPLIAQKIINDITLQTLQLSHLLGLFAISMFCASLGSVFEGIGRYFSSAAGTNAQYYLRKDIYESINAQSFKFFDNKEIGDLVSRTTSDIENAHSIFSRSTITFITSIITFIGIIIGAFITVKESVIAIIIASLLYSIIVAYSYKKLYYAYESARVNFAKITTIIRENLIGANVVRIFNSQNKELSKFGKKNDAFKIDSIKTVKWQTVINYGSRIITSIITLAAFAYGGFLVISGEIMMGTLIAFMSYISMLSMPFNNMGQVIIDFVQSGASIKRVNEIIESVSEITEKKNAFSRRIKGDVEFREVSFGYAKDSMAVKKINFKASAGQTIAIIGTTGSGKTSLINLIPRYYDADKGEILIDNMNIKNYNISNLRSQIGFCSQEVFLFNISIADNIRFGKPNASFQEVIDAAKSANIHDFIMTLPKGYDTIIGERGSSLSGGQKQRIAIARALILNPKILILDDSTSAVDTKTEYQIQKALENLMKNRTSFIITQRVNNLKTADLILLMDKGAIIASGKHEKLYLKNNIYTNIYNTLYTKQREAELELKRGEK
jgi:ATP-binding cassette subfamily B protein/subfamily B ATP-binding cassette protein MsbA